jgi:hypothetical protein
MAENGYSLHQKESQWNCTHLQQPLSEDFPSTLQGRAAHL